MSKRSNTVPYTNARREGRTNPDRVEFRDTPAEASVGPWVGAINALSVPNRQDLRARGIRGPQRRRYVARCRRLHREAK